MEKNSNDDLMLSPDEPDENYEFSYSRLGSNDSREPPLRSTSLASASRPEPSGAGPTRTIYRRKSFLGMSTIVTAAFEVSLLYPTGAVVILALRHYSWPFFLHPLSMAIGYFFLVNAVSFLHYKVGGTPLGGSVRVVTHPSWIQRKDRHKLFSLIGFVFIALVGLLAIVANKIEHGKPHFVSLHALVGLMVCIALVVQGPVIGTVLHFRLAPRFAFDLIKVHRFLGNVIVLVLAFVFFLGLRTKWFLNCWATDINLVYSTSGPEDFSAGGFKSEWAIDSFTSPRWVDLLYNSIYFFFFLNLCIYFYNFTVGRLSIR